MNKREFIKTSGIVAAGIVLQPFLACESSAKSRFDFSVKPDPASGDFSLPELGYAFAALEPHVDALTMEIHHGKHHQAYVTKLNEALKNSPLAQQPLEEILAKITASDTAIRNHGGGHYNHSLFWKAIAPKSGGVPAGKLAAAINADFGSFEAFRAEFSKAASTGFGSGWAWLSVGGDGKLFISTTPNQDNPLMANLVEKPGFPVLGLDVWEHAYYLNYQNKRADYIAAFFNIIDWKQAGERFESTAS